jgi:hypothetical protein
LNYISSLDNLRVALKRHVLNQSHLTSPHVLQVAIIGLGSGPDYAQVPTGISAEARTINPSEIASIASRSMDVVIIGPDVDPSAAQIIAAENALSPDGILIVASTATPQASPTQPHVTDVWQSPFGSSFETITTFRLGAAMAECPTDLTLALATPVQNSFPPDVPEEVEHGAGTLDCYEFLVDLHKYVEPRFYTEIGVEYGASLKLAQCPALGIDPAPQLSVPIATQHSISYTTSDDYFRLADTSTMKAIDLCYIDGMHQIEFALKDFMNMERFCHAGSVVIVDDIYPAHPLQGERIRQSRYWTGDIWKIIPILQLHRPDLIVMPVDTDPTGSLMVLGLDPNNNVLWDHFDSIIDHAINTMTEVPESIIERTEKFDPRARLMKKIFKLIRKHRGKPSMAGALDNIRTLINKPKLRKARSR